MNKNFKSFIYKYNKHNNKMDLLAEFGMFVGALLGVVIVLGLLHLAIHDFVIPFIDMIYRIFFTWKVYGVLWWVWIIISFTLFAIFRIVLFGTV